MLKLIQGDRAVQERDLVEALFSDDKGNDRADALLKALAARGTLRIVPMDPPPKGSAASASDARHSVQTLHGHIPSPSMSVS